MLTVFITQRALSTSIRRRSNQRRNFDVEKALKHVRIFQRPSKKRRNFDVRRRFDVKSISIFQRFFTRRRKKNRKSVKSRRRLNVEILTVPTGYVFFFDLKGNHIENKYFHGTDVIDHISGGFIQNMVVFIIQTNTIFSIILILVRIFSRCADHRWMVAPTIPYWTKRNVQ